MTDIRPSLNVMVQSAEVGQIALTGPTTPTLLTVYLDSTVSQTIVPGSPLRLIDGACELPLAAFATAGTTPINGLVVWNAKYGSWTAGGILQILMSGAMQMKAAGTLARNARVGLDASGNLIAATAANDIGYLLDTAVLNAIVRVELDLPRLRDASGTPISNA